MDVINKYLTQIFKIIIVSTYDKRWVTFVSEVWDCHFQNKSNQESGFTCAILGFTVFSGKVHLHTYCIH